MTRILHILDHSLPMQSGYSFRTRAILKAQQRMGWTVAGLTGVRHATQGADVALDDMTAECHDGLDFYRTPRAVPLPAPFGELNEVRALARRARAIAKRTRSHILHAHSPALDGLAALRAARATGLPFIYEIRAFWEDAAVGNGTGREGSWRYRMTRALETFVARQADHVVVICDGLRADLIERGLAADRLSVVPNGVDLAMFGKPPPRDAMLAAELGLNGAEVIGFIGSFYDYEGLDDLIAAMPGLVARRPRLHLLLVGGGPMEPALRAASAASPVAAHIHFIGRVPHADVERYYSIVDLLVYPRKSMRLTELVTPLKPLEAMAQHKLVAASNIGGHRELIADGVTGSLFRPDDPAAIITAIDVLFSQPDGWARRIEAARTFVARDHDWARNVARYAPIYTRLTAAVGRNIGE